MLNEFIPGSSADENRDLLKDEVRSPRFIPW